MTNEEKIKALSETLNSMHETNNILIKKINNLKKKLDNKDAQIHKLEYKMKALEFNAELKRLATDCYWVNSKIDIHPINFIKNVHFFNDKTTVVYWRDNTKTVVVTQDGDTFNKELGLAMAISKKFFGNTGVFNEAFKKYCYGDNAEQKNLKITNTKKHKSDFDFEEEFEEI